MHALRACMVPLCLTKSTFLLAGASVTIKGFASHKKNKVFDGVSRFCYSGIFFLFLANNYFNLERNKQNDMLKII